MTRTPRSRAPELATPCVGKYTEYGRPETCTDPEVKRSRQVRGVSLHVNTITHTRVSSVYFTDLVCVCVCTHV